MTFTPSSIAPDPDRRFGGLSRLYGGSGAKKIRAAHIVVVGLGGVGSWAAEAAARSGVACLTLIDLDHIAESNINRQVHALDTTLGQSKVQAMRDRIALINPDCRVDCIEDFVEAENWPDIVSLDSGFDSEKLAIIDACDQVRAKTAMAAWAIKNMVNLISVGAAGGKRLAHKVDIDDLAAVTHDPLLAQMRYRLRKEHRAARLGKMSVPCVFSREPVMQPSTPDALLKQSDKDEKMATMQFAAQMQPDGSLNCHGYGSVVSVTATFGLCAASWVLNKIAA
ncbi:MAG: tRNA threonylcarbamoyladenosine dehydratase [Polaromonas sp.]